jgi:subtilisin family serine protease
MNISLAWFSNWGQNSVDIAAPGSNLSFYLTPNESIIINGTSYSNAIISAYSGATYDAGMSIAQLRDAVLGGAVYHPNLYNIKLSSYILY